MYTIDLRSPLARIVAVAVSLAITAVVWFGIVQPQVQAANQQARQTIQQVDQLTRAQLDQVQRQVATPVVVEADDDLEDVAPAGVDLDDLGEIDD